MATTGDFRARFAAAHDKINKERALLAINEEQEAFVSQLKMDFINKCSVSNAFKLDTKDLQSVEYKSEIRFLICRKYFPELQSSDIFLDKLTSAGQLNSKLSAIEALNPRAMAELLQLNSGSGLGPGEALLYFLLDNTVIGGGSSAGVDVIDNGTKYELKAVKLRKKDMMLTEFKLGGTVDISGIQSRLMLLKRELLQMFPKIKEGEKTGINNDHLDGFQHKDFVKLIEDRKDLTSFEELELEFAKLAYNEYFKAHPIIFMGSKDSGAKYYGRIFDILEVQEKDIKIHQVTSSTIKPGILINKINI